VSRRQTISLLVGACLLAAFGPVCLGQEAAADQAKEQLARGIQQYKALDFRGAKATLLKVAKERESLPAADAKALDYYLNRVDGAINKQAAAMSEFQSAVESLRNNDLEKAKAGFAAAAASEYIPPAVRQQAREQLALVDKRSAAAAAAARSDEPQDEPTATPAAAEGGEKSGDDGRMLAELQARRAKAQEFVVQAKSALDNNQPEKAADLFRRALSLQPDNEEARRGLDYASGLTVTAGQQGLISRIEKNRRIARQMADVEYEKAMRRAHESLAVADSAPGYARAADSARLAQNVLETNKSLYPATDYRRKLAEVQDLLTHIRAEKEAWEKRQVEKQRQEIAEAERIRVEKEHAQRARKLETLTERARSLSSDHKYAEAVEIYQQIHKLAPTNREAIDKIELLTQFVILQDEKEADRVRTIEEQKSMVDIRWSEVPWYELLKYPRDWREITVRREPFGAGTGSESEADRRTRQRLRATSMSPKMEEAELKSVIDSLREVTGANFWVDWDTLQAANIDKSSLVTVNLRNVSAETVLRKVLDSVSVGTPLNYAIQEGVVTISTRDVLEQRTEVRVYDIRDLTTRVPNFEGPRIDLSTDSDTNGTNDSGGTTGGFGGGLFEDDDDDSDEDEGNYPTRAEIIADIIETIQETIASDSWRPEGETGAIRELAGQLIVTQTPENHSKLLDLLSQLREARALQVAIEARFISVNTGFLNSVGIDLDFFFNLGSRLGSGTNRNIADPWTGGTHAVNRTGSSSLSDHVTPVNVTQGSAAFANMIGLSSPVANSIGGLVTAPSMSISGTFLDDIQVDFLIDATQAHQSTRSLTAPRLALYNGQRAYITVATQQAYVSDIEPIVSDNSVAFDPILSTVPTGTVLDVEATISADRRYVTLTVRPQVASLNGFSRYFTDVTTTDPVTGEPLTGDGFIQLPNVTIQDLQTTVSVPDGGTLLLGGQKLAGEVEREMGVPVLSKVPVINRFVTNRGKVRDEQTLLILIKPKIIIQREEEEKQFP